MTDRNTVLETIKFIGERCCVYGTFPDGMCDCKYGIGGKNKEWPTINEIGNGCPELRTLYHIISSITDEEWMLLIKRSNGIPSGLFVADHETMEKRLHLANSIAVQITEQVKELCSYLTFERDHSPGPT